MGYGGKLPIWCVEQRLQLWIRELGEAVLCRFVQGDLLHLCAASLPQKPLQEDVSHAFGRIQAGLVLILPQDSEPIVNNDNSLPFHCL